MSLQKKRRSYIFSPFSTGKIVTATLFVFAGFYYLRLMRTTGFTAKDSQPESKPKFRVVVSV